ncbi:MAG: hypothetical protein JRE43_04645 [Deltaproteobacteria bacterium]|nr:hypothetical protein [Deltaproteobacteria bacterium]MBW2540675.1 hypothetical protein [Deltaproteobacteria bacterium]
MAALVLALSLGSFAPAEAGRVCEVSTGPVSLIVLASGPKVHAYARTLEGTVARRDAETVIFHDGRVVTADIGAAARHLDALGWGSRDVRVVASFPPAKARPRRRG